MPTKAKSSPADGVVAAEATLSDLEARKAALDAHLDELAARKVPLAYDALTGNAAAVSAVQELDAEAARISRDVATYEAAIQTAKANLAAAQAIVADAAERLLADKLKRLGAEFSECGVKMESALAEFCAAYAAMDDLMGKVRAIDPGALSIFAVRINTELGIQAMLIPLKLNSRHVLPAQRWKISAIFADWAAGIEKRANQRRAVVSGRAAA